MTRQSFIAFVHAAEHTEADDLVAGTNLLLALMVELAGAGLDA